VHDETCIDGNWQPELSGPWIAERKTAAPRRGTRRPRAARGSGDNRGRGRRKEATFARAWLGPNPRDAVGDAVLRLIGAEVSAAKGIVSGIIGGAAGQAGSRQKTRRQGVLRLSEAAVALAGQVSRPEPAVLLQLIELLLHILLQIHRLLLQILQLLLQLV
jgi:hypothetical protein